MLGKLMEARAAVTNEFLEYEICAMFAFGPEQNRMPGFGFILTNLGVF
jgi:hypothetical protein